MNHIQNGKTSDSVESDTSQNSPTYETVVIDAKEKSGDELDQLLAPAASALRQGLTVALPTETVYGLGADATSDEVCLSHTYPFLHNY
jgi:tRNA A37 threonylcarbamoyladenosine synthetase subunit TsaC/SUA5/YrdC